MAKSNNLVFYLQDKSTHGDNTTTTTTTDKGDPPDKKNDGNGFFPHFTRPSAKAY